MSNSNVLWQMLSVMNNLYVPAALGNATWPQSLRTDMIGSLHKFMASLTEHTYETFNKTVLYIPKETIEDPVACAKDKSLVQRLETSVIHWTRQIKEVVNYLDNSGDCRCACGVAAERGAPCALLRCPTAALVTPPSCRAPAEVMDDDGPLGEIRFWAERSKDLSSIRDQLDHPLVARMSEVLRVAKSSYLQPFQELSSLIQMEAAAAEDNLQFLKSLSEPCMAMSKVSCALLYQVTRWCSWR